jgi:hypothetical protein
MLYHIYMSQSAERVRQALQNSQISPVNFKF